MKRLVLAGAVLACACAASPPAPAPSSTPTTAAIPGPPPGDKTPSVAEIVARSQPSDWRALDPENTIYMDFPAGRVIIELAPDFAPRHVANVKTLSREGYFRNGAVTRVQDNYVAQWAQAADPERPPVQGVKTLPAEFIRPRADTVPFTLLPDPDTYAPEVGFSNGFPVGRDGENMWLTHCYGVVGVGRENGEDTGGGTELYAIIGTPARGLDRNITILGRVVQGMELLSSLPRGPGAMGFFEDPRRYTRFADMKVAADVPAAQRTNLEVMKTDSAIFAELVNSRRWRKDDFYHRPVGRVGLCNINVPVRVAP